MESNIFLHAANAEKGNYLHPASHIDVIKCVIRLSIIMSTGIIRPYTMFSNILQKSLVCLYLPTAFLPTDPNASQPLIADRGTVSLA